MALGLKAGLWLPQTVALVELINNIRNANNKQTQHSNRTLILWFVISN